MKGNQIFYHLREGVRSIFSHGLMSFAAVCMIIACLLIMGSFSLVAINVDNMLTDLENDNEFLAYVDDDFSENEARKLQNSIEAVGNVSGATFVSKEEAMRAFLDKQEAQGKTSEELKELFGELPDDTFRHRYRIQVDDITVMEKTVDEVKNVAGIAKTQANLQIADGFIMVRNVAGVLAIILVIMLVVISLFIIANTVRLATFARREEIAIMKMCGATNWFIRWPFVVEGVILGLFGAVLAFFLQWSIYRILHTAVENIANLSFIHLLPFSDIAPTVLLCFLGAGFLIGASGSALAIRRFLRV